MESKIYNQLSKDYNKLFTENIIQFQKNSLFAKNPRVEYVDFYPSFGIKPNEKCEFLIYGQAVKGWGEPFNVSENEAIITNRVEKSIEFSNSFYAENNHSPLDWVNVHWSKSTYKQKVKTLSEIEFYPKIGYHTFRSFFWNVIYKVISDYYNLNREEGEWAKKIVWSNLYKIAPDKENPNDNECEFQLEKSIELVKREIEELNPKFCLVLTNGEWWLPFQKELKTKKIAVKELPLEIVFYEQYNNTKIIVTTRPFRGNGEEHVKQILQLIKSNFY